MPSNLQFINLKEAIEKSNTKIKAQEEAKAREKERSKKQKSKIKHIEYALQKTSEENNLISDYSTKDTKEEKTQLKQG